MTRKCHMAAKISELGASALCYRTPRPIDMRIETWTTDPDAVTCDGCKLRLKRQKQQPEKGS